MGCVSFSQAYFPGGVINKENFQRARLGGGAEAGDAGPGSSVFRDGPWRWAPPAPLKPPEEVLVAMGEKDGFITPERLEMLVNELLKHKNFDALSLPGLSEDRKAVFAPRAGDPLRCV